MATAVSITNTASQPLSLLAAPSSCSMYSSAFFSAVSLTASLRATRSATRSCWVMLLRSIELDALFGEVLHRAGVPRDRGRVLLLVLQLDILGLLVHRDDVGLVVE